MRSIAPIRTAKIGYIAVSAALCALGIALIAIPAFSASLLGSLCGFLLLAFGCVKLVGFFSKDLYRLAFQYDLALGILLIALGVILLVHPKGLVTFLCITLGLFILTDGLFKIQIAMEAKRFGIPEWWLILAIAILAGGLGLVLMLRPGEGSRILVILLGVTLLFEGVLNLSTVITAVKIIKHQQPDVVEADCYEQKED